MPWTLLARLMSAFVIARVLRRSPAGRPRPAMTPAELRRRGAQAVDGARVAGLALGGLAALAVGVIVGVAAATELALGPAWVGWVLAAVTTALFTAAGALGLRVRTIIHRLRHAVFTVIDGS